MKSEDDGKQSSPRFVTRETLPERATPENAHLFPALLKEIEQLEETVNRAKDPWARGVVSLFLLAHSDHFHRYVTPEGHLSDEGRNFLSTIKGADREIDPALVPVPTQPASQAQALDPAPAPGVQPVPQTPAKPARARLVEDTFSEQEQRALEQCFRRLFPTRGRMLDVMTHDKDIAAVQAALARPASRQFAMNTLAPHRTSAWERHRKTAYECLALARSQTALDWFAEGLADADGSNCHFARHKLTERALDPKTSMRAQYAVADMLFQENRFARGHAASLFESISTLEALVVCDRLVRALGNQHIAGPLSRALVNAARRIDTRLSVYQALLQGLAHQDVNVRAATGAIVVKLLGDEKVALNTSQWLLTSATDRDPLVRAGVGLSLGRASIACRPRSIVERETLDVLARDRDARVREKAAWALEQASKDEAASPEVPKPPAALQPETEKAPQPMSIEEQLLELRNGRDDAKWNKDRPAFVATLCTLPPEQRMEAVRETLMHKSEFFGPMRVAEAYADIAARIPLTPGEIVFLLERRVDGWSELRNNLDLALSAARTVQVRGRFLSRDAYFEVMKKAVAGAYGDAVKGAAQRLLDLAARNNDLRARDLLYDQDKTSEPSPSPARNQQTTTPDRATTAPLVLDPQELVKLFMSYDVESRRALKARVDRWLGIAKENPHEAHRIREAMQRTVRLEGIDPLTAFAIVDTYFQRFLYANLLRQEDIELLMELHQTFRDNTAGYQIGQLLGYARTEPKLAPLVEAAQAARAQRNATPAGASQPETAPLLLDARELLTMFQDGLEGLHRFTPHLRAWRDAASRDAEAAEKIWATVERVVELAQRDENATYRIVGACLERFLEADVLTKPTVELLLKLRRKFSGGLVGNMIAREWHNYLSVNPKVGLIAQASQGAPTPADPYLDPAKFAEVFDQGHHINMGPVNELLDYARTGPAEARAATRAMWQAVELLQGNDFGLLKIVRFGLREFARANLLGEEDYQQLLVLERDQRPRSEIQHEIEWIFQAAGMDPEKMHALVRAKQSLERKRSAGVQGSPAVAPDAFADMPPARKAKIESLVQDLLHGDTKARKKAAAEWARFVGEGNADTHAMPMLVLALRAADGEALEAATPFLANAIAKETNRPEKKRELVEAAHASNAPFIRAGAARILAALARLHEEK